MRNILFKILLMIAVVGLLMSGAPAYADISCPPTCTVQLQQTNIVQLSGVQVTVTIDNSGSNTVLSFQLTKSPLTNAPAGIDQIGWTGGPLGHGSNTFSTDYNSSDSNWIGHNKNNTIYVAQVTGPSSGSMDGFGKFNVEGAASGSTQGISPSTVIVLTLGGKVTAFYSNAAGNMFAVHIRFGGNCSGFVGGLAGTASTNDDSNCVPQNQVPEPGTLTSIVAGSLGLCRLLARRT